VHTTADAFKSPQLSNGSTHRHEVLQGQTYCLNELYCARSDTTLNILPNKTAKIKKNRSSLFQL